MIEYHRRIQIAYELEQPERGQQYVQKLPYTQSAAYSFNDPPTIPGGLPDISRR